MLATCCIFMDGLLGLVKLDFIEGSNGPISRMAHLPLRSVKRLDDRFCHFFEKYVFRRPCYFLPNLFIRCSLYPNGTSWRT